MPALDLGPWDGFAAMAASYVDRARVRKLLKVRLDCTSKQRRLRLVGAARRTRERGVHLGREFQVQVVSPRTIESVHFIT